MRQRPSLGETLAALLLRGAWPRRRRESRRAGFMILMTLIAVAVVGLLMVSAAPDLSTYNATLRSLELDAALTALRRPLSQRPLLLTTPGRSGWDARGLHEVLDGLTIARQVASSPDGKLGAAATFLSTIPVDPHVPAGFWYRGDGEGQKFWEAGYNMVRTGNFARDTRLEAYEPGAFQVFYIDKGSAGGPEVFRVDRFGQNRSSLRVPGVTSFRISPDGTLVAFLAAAPSDPSKIELFVSRPDGSILEQVTASHLLTYERKSPPVWSPRGDLLAFVVEGTTADDDELRLLEASGREIAQAGRMRVVSDGVWAGMEIGANLAFSPDQRFLAYTYRRSPMTNHRIAIFDTVRNRHIMTPEGSRPEASEVTNLSFAFNGQHLMYGAPGSPSPTLHVLRDLRNYPLNPLPETIGNLTDGPYHRALWFTSHVRAAGNVSRSWIVFGGGPDLAVYIKPAQLDDPTTGKPWPPTRISPAGEPVQPGSLALSRRGVFVAYRGERPKRTLHITRIDGSTTRILTEVQEDSGSPYEGSPIAFGEPWEPWTVPPANAGILSSARKSEFDAQAFKEFLNAHSLFDGDPRFGSSFLRITAPGRQHHFMVDNGRDTYLIQDDPEQRTRDHIALKRIASVNQATWDPKGLTFAAKSSRSEVAYPVDIFKNAIDVSATVVLLTTGVEPAISPDGAWIAVSKYMTEITTYPEPRISDPIPDMDIWIANAVGAPEPKERNLTQNTPRTMERYPTWSPDGRSIYYQRETQRFTFHSAHDSEIWRMTAEGGSPATVVSSGAMSPFWSIAKDMDTKMEAYFPAVSPDGGRLAFVGKERLYSDRNKPPGSRIGDIISEAIYILNLRNLNAYPVPVLRSSIPGHPAASPGAAANQDWGFYALSWNPNGQEIFAVRVKPIVRRFPGTTHEGYLYNPGQEDYVPPQDSELIRVIPERPRNGVPIGEDIDAPADNFDTLFGHDQIDQFGPGEHILFASHSSGPYAYQYIDSGTPQMEGRGIEVNRPPGAGYVLSAYVRTSLSDEHLQSAQVMCLLLDEKGFLLRQDESQPIFESGIVDTGSGTWNRYAVGIEFKSPDLEADRAQRVPLLLALYTLGPPGAWAEFTGLQLEEAFHPALPYPTVFTPTWNIHSPSLDPDPTRPGFYLFER